MESRKAKELPSVPANGRISGVSHKMEEPMRLRHRPARNTFLRLRSGGAALTASGLKVIWLAHQLLLVDQT
jgi:hypothetical protein